VIYRFGSYELDLAKRELRKDGEHVETEPKAFDLLAYLLEHAERAVSKEELQNELWPRSIVTETALTRCVMKARRAVGDDANRQSVIRTVHGHGYRFIVPLEATQERPPSVAAPAGTAVGAAPMPARKRTARYRLVLLGLIAAAGVLGLMRIFGPLAPAPADGPIALAVLPITTDIEDESLAWVRLGLMSLMNRMLEDSGVPVVSDRTVLSAIGDGGVPRPLTQGFLERMSAVAAASQVLDITLQFQNGLYRMSAVLASLGGQRTRRVIVGESPAAVAADMARVIGGIIDLDGTLPDRRLRRVSADPFINEAYARALDLELQGRLEEARTLFRLASEQEPGLFWLRYEIALCTRDLREWDAAITMFADLEKEARAANDSGALVATLNSLGVLQFNHQDYAAARTALSRALAVGGPDVHLTDIANIHVNLALVASNYDDRAAAKAHYEEALAAYARAETAPPPSFYNNFAGLLLSEGQLSRAREYAEKAVQGFQLRGLRRFEASGLNRLGKILRQQGDLDAALARHEQALAIQRDLGDAVGEIVVLLAITNVYRDKGDLTRARQNAIDVRDRALAANDTGLIADGHMGLAEVEEILGRHAVARDEFVAARNVYAIEQNVAAQRYADEGIARTTLALGGFGQARSVANDLLESARDGDDQRAEGRSHSLIAAIDYAEGDIEGAINRYLEVLEDARRRGDELLAADVATELAGIYLDQGLVDDAGGLIDEFFAPWSPDPAQARLKARLEFARGNRARAVEILGALRTSAGEAWTDADEALLRRFEAGDAAGESAQGDVHRQ